MKSYLRTFLCILIDISGAILNRTFSSEIENYNAVIGLKGEYTINSDWYVPYHFDIGAGDSDLTWQGSASLAYHFSWG